MAFRPVKWYPVLVLAALGAGWTSPAQAELAEAKLETRISAYLAPLLATNNFSGVILVAEGDRILFTKGYGYADLEHKVPNAPDTLFQLASVSKPFTAAAVLRLMEQGKIDLKAPLTHILPDYPNGSKLTIHDLLTHSSGIANINDFPEYEEIQLRYNDPASLVDVFKSKPLDFEPGSTYRYSNSNYNLLALIIEKASGETYGEFLEREILHPLQLENTGHRPPMSKVVPGIADGYAPDGAFELKRADYLDWSAKTGNGSLYSSANDILRFVQAIHTGALLEPESVAASHSQHFPNIGYGWFLTEAIGRRLHHISGRSPGWTAQVDYYVEEGVSVIVLSNLYISVTTPVARAIGAMYFGEVPEPLPRLSAKKLASGSAARLIGTYQFGPDYYLPNAKVKIDDNNGELSGAYVGVDYPSFSFIPTEDGKFLIRSFWMDAEFVPGADGQASELKMEDFRGQRIAEEDE